MLAAKTEGVGLSRREVKSCSLWSCFVNMMLIPRSQSPLLWLSFLLFAVHLKPWSAQCVYCPSQRNYLLCRPEQLRQNENKWAQSCQVHPESFGGQGMPWRACWVNPYQTPLFLSQLLKRTNCWSYSQICFAFVSTSKGYKYVQL